MNLTAKFRTNYFKVKDDMAFENAMLDPFDEPVDLRKDAEGRWSVMSGEDAPTGVTPRVRYVGDDMREVEFDFAQLVAPHLQPGEVMVVQEISSVGLRSLSACAWAVDCTGRVVSVNIDDVYAKAFAAFGVMPCKANCYDKAED